MSCEIFAQEIVAKPLSQHALKITSYDYAVTENLDVALKRLDGSIILPGKIFSLNASLGKRTAEKGYKMARSYGALGRSVKDIGGGLCMISTILYNVFLKAGMGIRERHPHQRKVGYAPAGLDAAVYWRTRDLRIRNISPIPLRIRLRRDGTALYASLWPMKANLSIAENKIQSEIHIRRIVFPAIIKGTGKNGFRVRVMRQFYENGVLLRSELMSDDVFAAEEGIQG